MRSLVISLMASSLVAAAPLAPTRAQGVAQGSAADPVDPIKVMVSRLDLEKYKATVKGLTQFGDRRQGTDRNRAAIDWIETQLKSYGCANTERLKYTYDPPPPRQQQAQAQTPRNPVIASGEVRLGPGGSRYRGVATPTGVNTDLAKQPDPRIRQINSLRRRFF